MKVTRAVRSITTRYGDRGQTRLLSGRRVYKDDARIEFLGDLDELVAALGVVRARARRASVRRRILLIQRSLFVLGSEVAASPHGRGVLPRGLGTEQVALLDRWCAEMESRDFPRGFVVPGASLKAAWIDWARCVCRRCERRLVTLTRRKWFRNPHALAWINRLSDFLWLLARAAERKPTLLKGASRQ